MTKIAINPSEQFHNAGVCPGYIEGAMMGVYGMRVVELLNKYGAPSIEAKLFWDGADPDNYYQRVLDANAWGANYLVSFHTDSAGDKDNDGRGYTGSLLCHKGGEGYRMGRFIQSRMLNDPGLKWPDAGAVDRNGTLSVLDDFHGPSLLLEIGNHSDPQDCIALTRQADLFTKAIAWGIFNYLGINPKMEEEEEMAGGGPNIFPLDSDADGKQELAVFYDYGNDTAAIFIVETHRTGADSPFGGKRLQAEVYQAWSSGKGNFRMDATDTD